jgi:ATP-dependent Lhr-like helicase
VGIVPEVRDESLPIHERERRSMGRLAALLEQHVVGKRSLIFTNSRAIAEKVTAELLERGIDAHIHHGSVDQTVRRRTEELFRMDGPKTIVATSTLELGIDIGDLELSVQLGAPATASSFLQRLGRSGRRAECESVGFLYALDDDELPVALAVADLASRGVSEELYPESAALHVLFQQTIQLVRELDRVAPQRCFEVLSGAGGFRDVTWQVFEDLLRDLVEDGYLELERQHLRVGPETERRFGHMGYRDFYSVFVTDPTWTVKYGAEPVGTIDLRYPISENRENVFVLAGRKWRVEAIDRIRNLLLVEPAPNARVPRWVGDPVPYSYEVMRRTCELLAGTKSLLEHPKLSNKMAPARADAAALGVNPSTFVVAPEVGGTVVHTYAGFAANRYLAVLLGARLRAPVVSTGPGVILRSVSSLSLDEIVDAVQTVVASSCARFELQGFAESDDQSVIGGKFGPLLGARSRAHQRRANLQRDRVQFERLPLSELRVMKSLSLRANA